jgi:hypothetical protein
MPRPQNATGKQSSKQKGVTHENHALEQIYGAEGNLANMYKLANAVQMSAGGA